MGAFNIILGCAMAFLILLFSISSVARYYIKFTLFALFSLMFATLPVPFMLIKPRDPKNALIPAFLLRMSARALGIRWKVRGLENIDNTRGTVVFVNHQSTLDLYVLAILWPFMDRCTVIAKKAVLYMVPFGPAAWLWGTVFIDRRQKKEAIDSVNKETVVVRDKKAKLLLFPEGTRNSSTTMLPLKKGGFHVALDARAPIQPVVVSRYHFLDHKKKSFGSGELIVTILPLIETSNCTKDDIDILIDKTQAIMQDTYTKTSMETLPTVDGKRI